VSPATGLSIVVLAQGLLFLAATMVIRVAFGAAIMLSAPALVAYLLLPTAWDALVSTIHAFATLDHWLAIGTVLGPLAQHSFSAADWAHAGTTIALWMVLPLVIGAWRFARRDVN
jgi:ABC-2 type transport system permease protein